jgi:hypothetical protein
MFDMSETDIAEAVERLMDRGDLNHSWYYRALDAQHFGASASASNFTELKSAADALAECIRQRGDKGCDRDKLLKAGCDPEALLSYEECRYWVFGAEGELGVISVDAVDGQAMVRLTREKPGAAMSWVLTGFNSLGTAVRVSRPKVSVAVAIVGIEDGQKVLWTIHPGLPAPSGEGAAFEEAGYREGDEVRLQALVDANTWDGSSIRRSFEKYGVTWKTPVKVKVPVSAGVL